MTNQTLDESSASVQTHLGIIQGIIQRMAANSAFCKGWCITLVSAILVIVADKGKPEYALLSIIPSVLFMGMDSYYLALEKMFRQSYNDFIKKLHDRSISTSDLYATVPTGGLAKSFVYSLCSLSIWPFYLTLLVMILISMFVIAPQC